MSSVLWMIILELAVIVSFVAGSVHGRASAFTDLFDTLQRYGEELWPRVLKMKYFSESCHARKNLPTDK